MFEDSYLDLYWESRYDFGYDGFGLDTVFDEDVWDGEDLADLDLDDEDGYWQ